MQILHGGMDDYIAFYFILGSYWGKSRYHIFIEHTEEIAYSIEGTSCHRGTEIRYRRGILNIQWRTGVQYNKTGWIDNPDRGIQESINGIDLSPHGFQSDLTVIQVNSIGIGYQQGFLI